jgi:hypothetical protein
MEVRAINLSIQAAVRTEYGNRENSVDASMVIGKSCVVHSRHLPASHTSPLSVYHGKPSVNHVEKE